MKHLLLATMIMLSVASQSQIILNNQQSNGTALPISISTQDSNIYTNNNLITLTTLDIVVINFHNRAKSGGKIIYAGSSPVTQRGVCWAKTQNPTIANNFAVSGNDSSTFTADLTGLSSNTTYYVRAYAINKAGTAYGNQLSFRTPSGGTGGTQFNPNLTYGTVRDIDSNIYLTIRIGNQVWMAENLRTTKYRNNTPITYISNNGGQWSYNTTGAWSYFNNDFTNNNPFGKLYNWYAVTNRNGICPSGWHVPTDAEWALLTSTLGADSLTGGKMKSIGTQYWKSPNTDATNSSGWTGLPGGFRYFNGSFNSIGYFGSWWSSTENTSGDAWHCSISTMHGRVARSSRKKAEGFSVRCVRN